MGTNFYWFYDLLLAGIVIGFTFKCSKRGFAASVMGVMVLVISFGVALTFSGRSANYVYDTFIKDRVEDYISGKIPDEFSDNVFMGFSAVETENIRVDGKSVSDVEIAFDPTGKTVLDLKKVDLSRTGIEKVELSKFGIELTETGTDEINLGKTIINLDDMKKYDLEDLIFAKALVKLFGDTEHGLAVNLAGELLKERLPMLKSGGSDAAVYIIIALVNSDNETISAAVSKDIIKPPVIKLLRTVLFFFLFSVSAALLSKITLALEHINHIPVVGRLNSLLGAAAGLLQAFVILFILVILLHIFTGVTGNTIVFLNEAAINNSLLFKYIYNYQFLNFTS